MRKGPHGVEPEGGVQRRIEGDHSGAVDDELDVLLKAGIRVVVQAEALLGQVAFDGGDLGVGEGLEVVLSQAVPQGIESGGRQDVLPKTFLGGNEDAVGGWCGSE